MEQIEFISALAGIASGFAFLVLLNKIWEVKKNDRITSFKYYRK